jgi:hypothetical protein
MRKLKWAIPIIIFTAPVEEPWNFQRRDALNFKFPGEEVH